ncbi:MAG: hypothetical protein Q7R54_03010 [bacterium]|nr:hypothetical protein [bacterium]
MKDYLKNLQVAFALVFANISYIALASTLAIAAFLFVVWLPNLGLLGEVFTMSSASLAAKLTVAISLIGTNGSILSAGYTILIALLFGINIAMIVYFFRRVHARLGAQEVGAGLGGIISGLLGIGCAACGSLIVGTAFWSLGAASVLAVLPLEGGEFGILSVLLLAFSLALISKKIAAPETCELGARS